MEAGSVVRAIFDFCPSVLEELPLFVGDIIEVLAVVDEFWLFGKKDDVTGQFPSSFVEIVTIPSLKEGERLFVCICDFTSHELNSLPLHRGDLVILDGAPTASWLQGRSCWGARGFFPSSCVNELCLSSRSRRWHSQSTQLHIPDYSMGQARALMGLSAQLDEELDFREGDVITIVGVPEPGWFEGELEGRRGIFPEGFVELLGPLRTVDESVSSGNREDRIVNGELDTPAEEERGPEEDDEEAGSYGIALYRFQALEPNELDFEVGDKIQILGTLEDGWLEGSLRGRTGIFPYRFVKQCPKTREEETVALPQESIPETSLDDSENSLVAEENRLDSLECETERPNCVISETFTPSPEHLTSEYDVNKSPYQDGGTSGGPPRSPGVRHEQPHPKDSSMKDASEAVNGVSSQPQIPLHPKVQKPQYYSTVGGSLPRPELHPDPAPPEARARHYFSLPPIGTHSPPKTLQKPVPPLHSGSFLSPSRTGRPNRLSPQPQRAARCAKTYHTPKENASSVCSASEKSDMKPGPQDRVPVREAPPLPQGDGHMDLDSKLTQQLLEFEKSVSAPGMEPDAASRHFSITDFNSERDVVQGSSKLMTQQELPGKRKTLRPPPPRPSMPASTSPHVLVDQNLKPELPLAVRPSRPAPLPPSAQQRMNAAPPRLLATPHPSCETLEKEGPETMDKSLDQTPPCPLVLVRIQEMERELDVYSRAQEELNLMLQKQEDSLSAETLENLEFYESNIESLTMELQHLRAKGTPALVGYCSRFRWCRPAVDAAVLPPCASLWLLVLVALQEPSPWNGEAKPGSLSTLNMCEPYKIEKHEREAEKKGLWGSTWEYEGWRGPRRRGLAVLEDLYGEDDVGSSRTRQNWPYRKRDCRYWDLEQSEQSYTDYQAMKEAWEDHVPHGSLTPGCDGRRNSENVDCGNLSPGKDDWLAGSPDITWKAGGYGERKGGRDHESLDYNPKDSKETEPWAACGSVYDFGGDFEQPQNRHMNHRNVNYNLEDYKEVNFYYRNHSDLYHVPGNYTAGQSSDFSHLNGVSESKEFMKYSEGDKTGDENDNISPRAKTCATDHSKFDTENKGYDILLASRVCKHQNCTEKDSPYQMTNLECCDIDEPGMMALGSRETTWDALWDKRAGEDPEGHRGVPQGPALEEPLRSSKGDRELVSLDTWRRNSCLRRTAPSALRRSEFLQNRKSSQEMTLLSSQSSSPMASSGSVSTGNPEQRMLEKRSKVIEELLQTERDYIRDLEMCIERIMVPLQQAQVPNIDFEGLFGNMQMVIKVSKQLLADLEICDTVGMSPCHLFKLH
ncbi:Dynamin-binding protein [Galemys pyrenaicus]|uniref:Dynamin-binding protein n=1 Tax=Galemys pyrenaicus TaxID=202257 RepID=A0A8J6AKX0_GALPY|nr:Dynamin-binding protein [Galemys pyrenaicus]